MSNCYGILAQREQELQQLTKILELRELELARLKASSLTEGTIPGFTSLTSGGVASSHSTSTSWLQGPQHHGSHEITATTWVTTTTPNLFSSGDYQGSLTTTTTSTWVTTRAPNLFSSGDYCSTSSAAVVRTEVRGPTWNNKLLRYNNVNESTGSGKDLLEVPFHGDKCKHYL